MSECKTCLKSFVPCAGAKGFYCSTACSALGRRANTMRRIERGEAVSAVPLRRMVHEKFGGICQGQRCAWDFSKRRAPCNMEHIDGNSSNNAPSNLTLLCLNCHSMTPTYKNRNKGNGRAARNGRAFQ